MSFPLMKNNISREDLDLVIELLKRDDPILTNGPKVKEFERAWSEWLGVKYSTFVSSGAASNFITLQILKQSYPDGGEVIIPPLTWVSDVSSVIHHGFTPVFVDINPKTLSMSTDAVLKAITPMTRAVFITHAQGFNGLTDKLIRELSSKNILLIEDVCESHGATHRSRKLGTFGNISNFSFFYAHHMSTIEGGMICTDDPKVYEWARMLRSHGMVRESSSETLKDDYAGRHPDLNPDFIFAAPAFNFRNTEIGATIGLSQLSRLDRNNEARTRNFIRLLDQLDTSIFYTDFEREGSCNYAHQIVLKLDKSYLVEKLIKIMRSNDIEFRRGSAGGGNQLRQPYLRPFLPENYWEKFPVTEHIHQFGFYIGNYPSMSICQIDRLAEILNEVSK
ncbi:DegT/DnrJ/EryC1/StrS family aminotransferase [Litorivicinus sp.]|nr:DegT/DnrJ/EryC1/StrS family aminotransferase [Litorivicinus sp.]